MKNTSKDNVFILYFYIQNSKLNSNILPSVMQMGGTAVAQWLRCCPTNRKVAGSIPDGVI